MNEEGFRVWLETSRMLSPSSVKHYYGAIETLRNELPYWGLESKDLFSMTDDSYIDEILDNPSFQEKNKRGHNMYSAALNHLREYIRTTK